VKKPRRLKIPAEGAWSFETADVAEDFDHHVRSQLPWYDFVTKGLVHIARHYIPEGGHVADVGASTGNVGRAISTILRVRRANLLGIEPSSAMAKKLSRVGSGSPYSNVEELRAEEYEWTSAVGNDLIVAFLVLMFVAPSKRKELLGDMYKNLTSGGALVIVDRTALASGYAAQVLNRLTLAGKVSTGVPADEIVAKELSLSGVQRPLNPADLPGDPVEWFRYGDFAGWIVEKR
jgi:tRNA (cmo5U34)-methyltransferase